MSCAQVSCLIRTPLKRKRMKIHPCHEFMLHVCLVVLDPDSHLGFQLHKLSVINSYVVYTFACCVYIMLIYHI